MSLAWLAGGGCRLAPVGDRTELKSRKGSNGVTSRGDTMLPREPEKAEEVSEQEIDLPEQEIDLYDAIGRAIANLHAALAEVDAAWVLITAERPDPSAGLSPRSMLLSRS